MKKGGKRTKKVMFDNLEDEKKNGLIMLVMNLERMLLGLSRHHQTDIYSECSTGKLDWISKSCHNATLLCFKILWRPLRCSAPNQWNWNNMSSGAMHRLHHPYSILYAR